MKRPWRVAAVLPGSRFDKKALSEVQTGFADNFQKIPWDLVVDMLVVLLGIVFLLLILRRWLWSGKARLTSRSDDRVTDPRKIRSIISKSIDFRSMYDVDVMSPHYTEIYKGPVLGMTEQGIDIEMNSFIDPELSFDGEPARAAFRMSRLGQQEFYQFDTHTVSVGYTSRYGRREKVLRLALPKAVEVGQKRRALRIEPRGPFRFRFWLLGTYMPGVEQPLANFHKLHEVEITDISAVGLRATLKARTADLRIQSGDDVFFRLDLPTEGLDLRDFPESIYIKGRLVSVLRRQTGRRVMSREADEKSVGPHDVRLDFVARGKYDPENRTIIFNQTGDLAFEDVARWIQAYQRYHIQTEKDTVSRAERPANIYASRPPDITPRYPRQPPRRIKTPE